MTESLRHHLIAHLQDAHAMEQGVLNMLDSMIIHTPDPQMKQLLRNHRTQTLLHGQRLERRLRELGASRSTATEMAASLAAWAKGVGDWLRGDKPVKNLRDGFLTEYYEIATYEVLERIAARAGDKETIDIVRLNKQDEYEMARRLADHWDRAVDLSLESPPDHHTLPDASWASSSEADMGLGLDHRPPPDPELRGISNVDLRKPTQNRKRNP